MTPRARPLYTVLRRRFVGKRQYAMARAHLDTLSAPYTFIVIDSGEIIGKLDRVRGAIALALAAGYTADGTDLRHFPARARIGTSDIDLCFDGYAPYYLARTSRDTRAATCTVLVVHLRTSRILIDGNCRIFTHIRTGAEPHTPRRARLVSASKDMARFAISVSLIGIFILTAIAAYTMHDGDRSRALFLAHPEHTGDVLLSLGARGIALAYLCFALKESFGKRTAPRIAATAAIRARKMTFYLVDTRVSVYGEFFAEKAQAERNKRSECESNENGQYKCHEYFH